MRTLLKTVYWLLVATLIGAAAFGSIVLRRSRQLETMTVAEAARQNIDARLFLALVQKCSDFQPTFADHGRYGLLALTEADGLAWAGAAGSNFDTFDLFEPEKNLKIGAWKLGSSLNAWSRERNPEMWALAEWCTNRETVRAWSGAASDGRDDPLRKIADPRVRQFVSDILRQSRREAFTIVLPWRPH